MFYTSSNFSNTFYDITICDGDNPNTMVILKKPNGFPESLTLSDTKAQRGNFFEATTIDKMYVLSKIPKGDVFTITKLTNSELLRSPSESLCVHEQFGPSVWIVHLKP